MRLEALAPPLAFAGVAVSVAGADRIEVATADGVNASPDALFRVASVSKVVTALTYLAAARAAGVADPVALEASGVLGWPLTHPAAPTGRITAGQLLSHTAGLSDAAYAVPVDASLKDFIGRTPAIWLSHPPGSYFHYSNLGYILLAAMAEKLAENRFDRLAREHVLDPLGIPGGFNWSGVSALDRGRSLACFRRDSDGFHAQIDEQVPSTGVIGPDPRPHSLSDYIPGWNPAVFSPQGGLRTDLAGMLRLAKHLPEMGHRRLWRCADGAGETLGGLIEDWGLGVQINDTPTFYPRPLIGHFGNAYGFRGGIWHDRTRSLSFAVALNGFPMGDEGDHLTTEEQALFRAVAAL